MQEALYAPFNKKELASLDSFLNGLMNDQAPDKMKADGKLIYSLLAADTSPITEVRSAIATIESMMKSKTDQWLDYTSYLIFEI